MSGHQFTLVVMAIAVVIGSLYGWTAWLNARREEKRLEQTIALAAREQDLLALVCQALAVVPPVKGATDAAAEVNGD